MRKQQAPYVIVVDDEHVIAETLTIILNASGFSAAFFTSPLDALESAQIRPPDLLISDVVMPQLSGVDLAIRMKAACPHCKILLFSGQSDTLDLLIPARQRGPDFHLLSKSIHPIKLLKIIWEQEPSWLVASSIRVRPEPKSPRLDTGHKRAFRHEAVRSGRSQNQFDAPE